MDVFDPNNDKHKKIVQKRINMMMQSPLMIQWLKESVWFNKDALLTDEVVKFLIDCAVAFYDEQEFEDKINYNSRNSYTMEPYHRLDVGCSFVKQKKWGERTWIISIYNIYNRQNPFFIFLKNQNFTENNLGLNTIQPSQISLFPIIPSIRYNIKF